MREEIVRRRLRVFAVDADRVAEEAGLGSRINTVMQTCFFAISGVLPRDEAIGRIKDAVVATYGRKGSTLVDRNFAAIDRALEHLREVPVPDTVTGGRAAVPVVPDDAPEFVRQVTAPMIAPKPSKATSGGATYFRSIGKVWDGCA